jgi:hypothetical protein
VEPALGIVIHVMHQTIYEIIRLFVSVLSATELLSLLEIENSYIFPYIPALRHFMDIVNDSFLAQYHRTHL